MGQVIIISLYPCSSLLIHPSKHYALHHRITRGHRNIVMHGHLTLRCGLRCAALEAKAIRQQQLEKKTLLVVRSSPSCTIVVACIVPCSRHLKPNFFACLIAGWCPRTMVTESCHRSGGTGCLHKWLGWAAMFSEPSGLRLCFGMHWHGDAGMHASEISRLCAPALMMPCVTDADIIHEI
jgi:hypothetical protein